MKLAIGIALFVWLLCGLAGGLMIREEDESLRWQSVVRGPITLVEALGADPPVKYPEPA